MKRLILSLCVLAACSLTQAKEKYFGGDISLLPEYSGATYMDHEGNVVQPLELFKNEGMNTMRVRLFVDPANYSGPEKDANACQDLEYVKKLGKQIKDAGFKLMVDFHYSDTWADPAKQWTPESWLSLTNEELYSKIYSYTKDALEELVAAGAQPDFIQTGNEVSYGMMWGKYNYSVLKKCYVSSDDNWDYFTTLLKRAGAACREVCPQAKIIIHTERVAQPSVLLQFYDRMKSYGVDYDIIGLSYYSYYHGVLETLDSALTQIEGKNYGKDIMIVETGYPYAWEMSGTTVDYTYKYPYSEEGQRAFTAALVELLNKHESVTGLFWWWMEYNAYNAGLSGWYNAPLFDSRSGKATSALSELKRFNQDDAVEMVSDEDDSKAPYYNLNGVEVDTPSAPGIYIHNGKKYILR